MPNKPDNDDILKKTAFSLKRVQGEIKKFHKDGVLDPNVHLKLEPKDENFRELRGEISGPLDTPYEGGIFVVDVTIPITYPTNPPIFKFVTKVWHPNISSVTGFICIDILKDQWQIVLSLRTVLLSLQALLGSAEPDDAQDGVVAAQFKESHEMYVQTARHWTNVYAGGPNKEPELEQKIEDMKALGYEENKARIALSNRNWVINDAIDFFK